ncbi:MAG: DUF6220 domain-containing protein [Chloroflexota bacterium]|nr:DUF6220 domain-containing protein [Chloroflexota bacterium]
MIGTARVLHHVFAWALVVGVGVQIFLAGLGVFAGASNFATHRDFGYLLELLPILLLVAAAVGRLGRRQIVVPIVIFALFILQSVFVALRESTPAVAALHPVNGFVIAYLALQLAREAWTRHRTVAAGAGSAPAASGAPGS